MKHCGVVTDRGWIEASSIEDSKFGYSEDLRWQTGRSVFGKDRRIYSDEVPMTVKENIYFSKLRGVVRALKHGYI